MSTQPRICLTCKHSTLEVVNGTDVLTCTHHTDGAPAPLHPHAQRTQPADAEANICGEAGIFWEAKN
jgi:hypothetical protein